jgi:phosphoribosylformylglycinamidine synthase
LQAAVIVFPGSNCDRDVAVALARSLGRPPLMIWHRETEVPKLDLVVLPGGFSYGDYLRCGAIAARSPVMRAVVDRAKAGMAVLGICNGFQILVETELLPGILLRNAGLRFVCRDVHLRVETVDSPFARGYQPGGLIRLPVAHGDGNYFADAATLDRLEGERLVAFRYVTPAGEVSDVANPNGSARNIAGIYDARRRVLGMMPHPERLADEALGGTDGSALFDGLVEALA